MVTVIHYHFGLQCPSASAQVYLVAKGGNPGLSPSTASNSQLTLMAALGSCSNLSSTTNITVNELTTVSLCGRSPNTLNSYSAVGSGAASDSAALASAFLLAAEFVNTSTGTAPGATLPTGYSAPVARWMRSPIPGQLRQLGRRCGRRRHARHLFADRDTWRGIAGPTPSARRC